MRPILMQTRGMCDEDRGQTDSFTPVRMIETEIGQPLQGISAFNDETGQHYRRACCLIRLHTQPLGIIEVQLDDQGLSAREYGRCIWGNLQEAIIKHLQEDGLPIVTELDEEGLPSVSSIKCIEEREAFLVTAPLVSIIVATRDHREYLARCLHALRVLHYPRYEIIVVDNASTTMETAEFVHRQYSGDPRVKYVREDHPGLSWARNRGIMAAQGEILAFTDDDVVVDPYWLVELIRGFRCGKKVACVTGLILPLELEGRPQVWFEEFGGLNKGFTRWIFDRTHKEKYVPLYPFAAGQYGAGASMAFTAEFLHSVDGFDLALGAGTKTGGGEDLAAFFQVIMSGKELVYEPASLLYHLHRRDYASLRKQIYYYGAGLVAFLTKVVFDRPWLLFDLLAKVPYGLFFIMSSRSLKNRKRSVNYPKDLIMLERKGMLYGPFAYFYGWWKVRKFSRKRLALENIFDSAIPLVRG